MIKKTVIAMIIILALTSIYSGAYKPLAKAQMYIQFQGYLPTLRTFDELTLKFNKVLQFNSPIGQREVVKFANSQFETMIMNENQSEGAALAITKYTEDHIFENNVVHLDQVGNMYRTLYIRFGGQEYLNKSEDYYKKIRKIGPKLPQGLYSLFYIYEQSGQTEKMKQAIEEGF